MSEKPPLRALGDGPFCWQHKVSKRRIREKLDGTGCVASGLGVYDAVSEIASDEQSDEFTTTHGWIAFMSGYDAKTVKRRMQDLKSIGLVEIVKSSGPLNGPNTYRLLRVHDGASTAVARDTKEPKKRDTGNNVNLPAGLNVPEFQTVWGEWLSYRKPKAITAEKQLKALSQHSPQTAVAMLERSMQNGWKGIFELKQNEQRNHHQHSRPVKPVTGSTSSNGF